MKKQQSVGVCLLVTMHSSHDRKSVQTAPFMYYATQNLSPWATQSPLPPMLVRQLFCYCIQCIQQHITVHSNNVPSTVTQPALKAL